jgi:hypothetical protein
MWPWKSREEKAACQLVKQCDSIRSFLRSVARSGLYLQVDPSHREVWFAAVGVTIALYVRLGADDKKKEILDAFSLKAFNMGMRDEILSRSLADTYPDEFSARASHYQQAAGLVFDNAATDGARHAIAFLKVFRESIGGEDISPIDWADLSPSLMTFLATTAAKIRSL